MGNGNKPTPEFRREAVRLALTSGRTRREIAEDQGVGLSTLTRWLGQDRGRSFRPVDCQCDRKARPACRPSLPHAFPWLYQGQRSCPLPSGVPTRR
jgi:Transposase